MKKIFLLACCFSILMFNKIVAQGPPIMTDKPIMLSEGTIILKNYLEYRQNKGGAYQYMPLMVHYVPKSNLLVALRVPFVNKDAAFGDFTLGDIAATIKYQFYRNDGMAKTFRMAGKVQHFFPTGEAYRLHKLSLGEHQTAISLIAGYESIRFGILQQLEYNAIHNGLDDELSYKLGFGLPLLEQVYPVEQLNLYFEYEANWMPQSNREAMYFSQGLQVAWHQITVETAVQVPIIQHFDAADYGLLREYSFIFGFRYIF